MLILLLMNSLILVIKISFLFCFMIFSSACSQSSSPVSPGTSSSLSYPESDVEKQFKELLTQAQKGNKEAMCDLGRSYYFGVGTEKNPQEAKNWLERAAGQGSAKASCERAYIASMENHYEKAVE